MRNKKNKHPQGELLNMINDQFGNFEKFQREYVAYANTLFGSGWSWLVIKDKRLQFLNTSNAENPIGTVFAPLCVIDLWEHAYYIDYRNKRAEYVERLVVNHINWDFCELQVK